MVIFRVEDNRSDEVNMLKDTEALLATDVPQSDGLVHAAGEDEVVLGPGDVQQVGGVARVRHEGAVLWWCGGVVVS